MGSYKILFINLGYGRGIDGRLSNHVRYAYRYIYCSPAMQLKSLNQLKQLIKDEEPDLCCFVEIDQGSWGSAGINQLDHMINEAHAFSDIENKYAPASFLRSCFLTSGKSNAFISRVSLPFQKIYFTCGLKRLIYRIKIADQTTLFFAHFSLTKKIRARQLIEARSLMRQEQGEVIFLGDFNILTGLKEIDSLLDHGRFCLLNERHKTTFLFHTRKLILDLCVCSSSISHQATLNIIPQPYTDHAALTLTLELPFSQKSRE